MGAAKPIPFDYQDLNPPAAIDAPAPVASPPVGFSAADLEEAFAAGRIAGQRATPSGAETLTLQRIAALADALAGQGAQCAAALEAEKASLRAVLEAFVIEFCGSLGAERAAEGALALIDRLIAASADMSPAALFISPGSIARFGDRLMREIAARGAKSFITIEPDPALGDSECRLAWRGGAATREFEPVAAEIRRLVRVDAPAADNSMEKAP